MEDEACIVKVISRNGTEGVKVGPYKGFVGRQCRNRNHGQRIFNTSNSKTLLGIEATTASMSIHKCRHAIIAHCCPSH